MGGGTVSVLCGGTYFTLILQAIKQGSSNETDVLAGLITVIKPDFKALSNPKGNSFGTLTSQYRSCSSRLPKTSIYLPFTDSGISSTFEERIRNEYQTPFKAMQDFTNEFIDVGSTVDKDIRLVKDLLELIKLDQSIKDTDEFHVRPDGQTMSKSELTADLYDDNLPALHVCLPAFLLGIWHFIIKNKPDNSVGKATINSWHEEGKEKHRTRKYIASIWLNVKRRIEFIDLDEITEDTNSVTYAAIQENESQTPNISNDSDSKLDYQAVEPSISPNFQSDISPEQIRDAFRQAIFEHGFEELINSNPSVLYDEDLDKIAAVVDNIYVAIPYALNRNYSAKIICDKINEFTRILSYHVLHFRNAITVKEKTGKEGFYTDRFIPRKFSVLAKPYADISIKVDKQIWDDFCKKISSLIAEICDDST